MAVAGTESSRAPHPGVVARTAEVVTALSMMVGRGAAARIIAELAEVAPGDQVVDIGCGPGTAAREAARRGATATGVDPSPVMLNLARRISRLRRVHDVVWLEGTAEAVPLSDGSATVVWALSSVHHWADRAAGVAEARRVLGPGGRMLLAERLTPAGARGHAAHGLTPDQASDLASELVAAGFVEVSTGTHRAGRRTLIVVRAEHPRSGHT